MFKQFSKDPQKNKTVQFFVNALKRKLFFISSSSNTGFSLTQYLKEVILTTFNSKHLYPRN